MGKKVMKLFLDTMLRAAVIILAVAIVVMLVLLARTMSKNKKSDTTTTKEAASIVTEETDPSDPTFGGENSDASDASDASGDDSSDEVSSEDDQTGNDAKNANIAVINASGESGVAATWQGTLNASGYSSVDIGTYTGDSQSSTTVYVSGSYDISGITSLFSSASTADKSELDGSLCDIDVSGADIVIVVGSMDAANN